MGAVPVSYETGELVGIKCCLRLDLDGCFGVEFGSFAVLHVI